MGTTASPFLNPIAAELEGIGPQPTAKALSRRARKHSALSAVVVLWVAFAFNLIGFGANY